MIVGIGGHLRAGKDSVAEVLCREYGFCRIGFADALKYEVGRIMRLPLLAYCQKVYGEASDAVLHRLLWESRDGFSRALLQAWGTELRRQEDPDYWVKAWQRGVAVHHAVVCPDVRFPNELETVRKMGGILVLIRRPGYNGDGHQSEQLADDPSTWDSLIENEGTLQELEAKVRDWKDGRD